ncbi:GNAT family N-acetyltransferase [Ktedonospora formicarum]|uniref:N-acetyltransferase domain-containing protein n=1 Tax=Ktedonospora formicarum TaxID=2778364 RepID=A0A8J3IDW4_9CHLR|nr:GNAT family N-acetyltransferase [Ktedonospora formicarum]GHO49524.1 hypothetical protein KSX_76870 [Ktedonospora formicarum]
MISRSVCMPDDYSRLDEFLRACEVADTVDLDLHREALQEQQNTDLFQVSLDSAKNVRGFARLRVSQVEDNITEGRYWYYLAPTASDEAVELLHWAEAQTLQRGGQSRARLFTASLDNHPSRFQFLEANGFSRVRYFFTMKQALQDNIAVSDLPAGYTLRNATLSDVPNYTELHNLAFSEHWNSQPTTMAELRAEKLTPEYRSELDVLAIAPDGALASFCTASIEPMKREGAEEIVGFIASLGTHPAHRGRGLGRALLQRNLRTLQALGITKACISVDAANPTGAVRLYESVGFQPFETWISYFKYL